jgi:hypothetical protein
VNIERDDIIMLQQITGYNGIYIVYVVKVLTECGVAMFMLSLYYHSAARGEYDAARDIGTFGEKHRRSQVVQTGGVSARNRISTSCTVMCIGG